MQMSHAAARRATRCICSLKYFSAMVNGIKFFWCVEEVSHRVIGAIYIFPSEFRE
jgi:hypothetical protein